jgi:CubicO group peptidase (beta-lactamase class C family)
MNPRIALTALITLGFAAPAMAQQVDASLAAAVDRVFAAWDDPSSPGCAVGVARDDRSVMERAYGMADLEHDIPNTAETIFEAGSVSKQFTAAAIVLLALDGKLSLDDDIRKYVPELPDYGTTITLRHVLTHTSGLRDWGSVAGIAGWGRSARTHTHDHVIDILSRQSALNFEPGAEYSYSNSGYNLLAVVVDRVSGLSFAEFSQQRIFEPLGMRSTQWRDDYRRIVKGRSSAYGARGGQFVIDRPIEDVHGNGGLLTTVGDLLTWNAALASGRLGGPRFVELMHQRGVLNDGDTITYASGLMISSLRNVPEVAHTGSTAGYRAFLARYPEQRLDVAVLCNVGNVNPGGVGRQVAAAFLGDAVEPVAQSGSRGTADGGAGRNATFTPAPSALADYEGTYYSADAEATFVVEVVDGELTLKRRPAWVTTLRPQAEDTFASGVGTIRFIRDVSGAVTQLSVQQARGYDLRFDRR